MGAKLFVQGTNQVRIEVASVDKDVFVAEPVGAEIDFGATPAASSRPNPQAAGTGPARCERH